MNAPVEKLSGAFGIGTFRFTLKPQEALFVPVVNKTNMLRGAFGTAFRRLCCIPQCRNAHECPLAIACPYKQVFEPSPPPDSDRLSKAQDVPRPFIFRTLAGTKTKFLPGEEFVFELILIGRALDFLPYFVLSFRELAAQGLGLNRAKCELQEVNELLSSDPEMTRSGAPIPDHQITRSNVVYNSTDQVFHTPKGLDVETWICKRIEDLNSTPPVSRFSDHQITRSDDPMTRRPDDQILKVCFLTPTMLKSDGSVVRRPDFHHLFKRLRDRINSLSVFFGSGPLNVDFAGSGRRAEHVRTVSCNVRWEERFRTSSKTHQRHALSGFIGEAVYQGDLHEFLPWLVLGELIHIGKHTAWGMGRIAVSGRICC